MSRFKLEFETEVWHNLTKTDCWTLLQMRGYTQRQPVPDFDPEVECWWKGKALARIIPEE